MTGKIFRSCVLVGLAAILVCSGLFLAIMANQYEQEIYRQMKQEAAYVSRGLEETGVDYFTSLKASQRLTWVDADGTVLYDSAADPAAMENHLDREEIAQALRSGEGRSEHLSSTVLEKTLYYALRLDDGTVLRVACTRSTVGAMVLGVVQPLLWVVVLALVLSGVLASRLARQITKPINSLDLENPRLDETYEELFPLVSRLREQNRTITRQMDDLSRRQREFTALAENMSEGVLLLDSKGTLLSGNQSAYALLGQGERPAVLRPDNCRREIWEAAEKALAGRHAETLMTADTRILEILASPVAANGQVTGAVILMVDVTEREERESLRREFSANVSHELKTPLTSISGFAELMKEGLVEPDKMKEFAGDIYKECSQLIALVDDILKLSRLDEGSQELATEAVDLYALSGDILENLRPMAAKRNITLRLEGDHQIIQGVWRILNEMVYNLCDNAIKYNKDGGRVTVRVSGTGESAVLSVADTGIGISKGQQERVFERFYRVDKSHSRRVGGTGLGLSIVKHGAQYHNARLVLDSEPGTGTTITLTFRKE
ncbi:ATP-binding protein [Evtepia sp.]|uniref:sensor histidine kinase n=1 Tax=Evtepia sp. TaxID=2773933 RepID=UPI002A7FCF6D|nr:ATP-binding protein [Evtepia sp.]MDY4431229.1 ATP-binding protein [Evtepia sp.]